MMMVSIKRMATPTLLLPLLLLLFHTHIVNTGAFPVGTTPLLQSRHHASTTLLQVASAAVSPRATTEGKKKRAFFSRFRPRRQTQTRPVVNDFDVLVRPKTIPLTTGQSGEQVPSQSKRRSRREKWEASKTRFYKTIDATGSLLSKLRRRTPEVQLQGGYADGVVRGPTNTGGGGGGGNSNIGIRATSTMIPTKESTPLYKASVALSSPTTLASTPRTTAVSTSSSSSNSPFDNFKEVVYGGIDVLSSNNKNDKMDDPTRSPLLMQNRAVPPVDPIVGTTAAIRQQQLLQRQQSLSDTMTTTATDDDTNIKDTVYKVLDAVKTGADVVASLPVNAVETAQATSDAANAVLDSAVSTAKTIASLPDKAINTANTVGNIFQAAVTTVRLWIDQARAVPQRVQETQEAVDKALTSAKIMAGLEERIPEPPKTPPPEPKPIVPKDLPLRVTSFVVTGTAKAAWFVGKGAVGLGVQGVRMAWKGTRRSRAKTTPAVSKRKRDGRSVAPPSPIPSSRIQSTAGGIEELETEVAEVLRMAEAALQDANVNKRTNKNNNDDTRSGTDRGASDDGLEPRLVSVSRKTGKKDPIDLAATAVALAERATQEGASPSKTVDRAVVSAAAAAVAASRDVLEAEKRLNEITNQDEKSNMDDIDGSRKNNNKKK